MKLTHRAGTVQASCTECATCGEPIVSSDRTPGLWYHRPTRAVGWSLPQHRAVRSL